MKFSFIYFFFLLIFSQSLSQDSNRNKYINNNLNVIETKNLEVKKLYELGDTESSKDFFLTNLFSNRTYDEILQFYQSLPTDFESPTIEKLVYKSDDLISIMPGSKLRSSNIELFLKNNRIRDFHSSCYINGKFSIEEARLINTKIKSF